MGLNLFPANQVDNLHFAFGQIIVKALWATLNGSLGHVRPPGLSGVLWGPPLTTSRTSWFQMPQDPFRVPVASVPWGRYVIAAVISELGQTEPTVCRWGSRWCG